MTYDPSYLDDSSRWKPVVGTLAAVILGLVLLTAAWGKAIHPEAFIEQIRFEGLDFLGQAAPVAIGAIALEVLLGAALLLGLRRWWVLLPTTALVLFFLFLTGRAYWRFEQGLITESESCGCFGNLVSRTPAQAFWQDLLLLGVPLVLAFFGRSTEKRRIPVTRLAVVLVLTAAAVGLSLTASELPLDNLATRLRPGVEVRELCAGAEGNPERLCLDTLIAELDHGHHWVVLTTLEEEEFLAGIEQLNRLALDAGDTGLWVVTAASEETVADFSWTRAPAFDVVEAPESLLKPLHRRLPRSFEVLEGEVIETRAGLPPAAI